MPDPAHVRKWEDRSGSFVTDGSLLALKDNKIHIHKVNGVKIAVPIEKMSQKDIEYAKKMLNPKTEEKKAATEPEHSENAGYSTEPGSGLQNQGTVRPSAFQSRVKAALARFEDSKISQSHQSPPKTSLPHAFSDRVREVWEAREARQNAPTPSLSDTYLDGLQDDSVPPHKIPPRTIRSPQADQPHNMRPFGGRVDQSYGELPNYQRRSPDELRGDLIHSTVHEAPNMEPYGELDDGTHPPWLKPFLEARRKEPGFRMG